MQTLDSSSTATHLGELRSAIVDRTLERSLLPEKHTIYADLLVNTALDGILTWMAGGDSPEFLALVDRTAANTRADQSLLNLFASTISASLDELLERKVLGEDMQSALASLQRDVDVHVSAVRAVDRSDRVGQLDAVDAQIEDLIRDLSAQDTLTAEHSRSVSMWCSRIAKRLSFSRTDTILVTRSGLVHDVGKIATPLSILTAPRGLDESEWAIMKQHTMEGAKIVEEFAAMRELVPAVRWHHERCDGKGYPDGLEGSSIPFAARVVNVADAFNAMIARRPYRAPLSPTIAIEELRRHSGSQFDETIVAAMIDVILNRDE
ncbi:MAG TPA: HD domain-containing phosphohydrolase [Candidatus Baltobacteraceae bacterium]|jgi:putative nucleotidyltransferase with HDIG domain